VILEVTALVAAVLTLVGFANVVLRRLWSARVRVVTSAADWVLYTMLLVQVATGILVATIYPWGSSWFAATLSPYLWSLVKLNPDVTYVTGMPFLIKAHVVGNWVLIGFFPFTRLVHVLVIPNMYLWRKVQVVRWNWQRRAIRRAEGK
jgi:nitrate reductase gamma subunit